MTPRQWDLLTTGLALSLGTVGGVAVWLFIVERLGT